MAVEEPLAVVTSLKAKDGSDLLRLEAFRGTTALSALFRFKLDLLAPRAAAVPFEAILGQAVSFRFTQDDGSPRHIHGMVSRFEQSGRDQDFTHYKAEVVPRFWLWKRRVQSRVFQRQTVEEILNVVLDGLRPNVRFDLRGRYFPRDYCVQYRESDFDFASRLMEEEGIFYYFEHSSDRHVLVVTDNQLGLAFQPRRQKDGKDEPVALETKGTGVRIFQWKKSQEVCSGRITLWDHCFELTEQGGRPKTLECAQTIQKSAQVGTVAHALHVAGNDKDLEIFDFPGGYAQRFDGIGPGREDRSAELPNVFEDARRTGKIRAEAEAARALEVRGRSNCGDLEPGYRFRVAGTDEHAGDYLTTRVEHKGHVTGLRAGEERGYVYRNRFVGLPADLPYRPSCDTPRPVIAGVQTATVVGLDAPTDEKKFEHHDSFVDRYGRIKVQFHWDRKRTFNAASSCWVRVAQVWAGNRWGAFFWPRPGQEVVVAFEEGDPDRPLVTGSVYNAQNMPPLDLTQPGANRACGIKSASIGADPLVHFNAMVFHDKPGREYLQIHSQTHDVSSSGASRSFNTPGAIVETAGSLLVATGSGSGGGPSASEEPQILPVPNPSQRGDIDYLSWPGWLAAAGLGASGVAAALDMPSKTSLTYGHVVNTIMLGNNVRYVLGGDDVNYSFQEPASWALGAFSGKFPLAGMGIGVGGLFLAECIPGWVDDAEKNRGIEAAMARLGINVAGLIPTLWPEVEGRTEMVVGQRFGEVYGGPSFQIDRCKKYTYSDPSWLGASWSARAATALTVAVYLANVATGVLAKLFNTADQRLGTYEHWSSLTAGTAGRKLHGTLQAFEKNLAMASAAKADAKSAAVNLKESLGYLLSRAAVKDAALYIPRSLAAEAKKELGLAKSALKDLGVELGLVAVTREVKVAEGDHSLIHNGQMTLASHGSNVNVTALHSATDVARETGKVFVKGETEARLTSGPCTLSLLGADADGNSALDVRNNHNGKIVVRQGSTEASPVIKLEEGFGFSSVELQLGTGACLIDPNGVELRKGDPKVMVARDRITLSCGPTTKIEISDKISLSCGLTNKIEISNGGISFNGLNIDLKAELNLATKTIKMLEESVLTLQKAVIEKKN